MSLKISRRDFLKISGAAFGGMVVSPYLPPLDEFNVGELARVSTAQISVHNRPDDTSTITGQVYRDQVLNIYEEVTAPTPGYNPVWYRVWGGYVHRARIQKVQYIYNEPAKSIRETKQIAEVTVPFTFPQRLVNKEWLPLSMTPLYFETIHWVIGIDEGPDGQPWYRLQDELDESIYNVPATHLRLIPDEELAPISPDVPFEKKRIEVSLNAQTVTCFEDDQPVFHTTISSGLEIGNPGKNGIPTRTPAGDFRIQVKMPSKHMGVGNLAGDNEGYDFPGVPWDSFFTSQGHAFHGAYWHNNFGVPMSHGCINMRTEEAKWLFRWCMPPAPASEISPSTMDKKGYGTPVKIRA